MLGRRPTKSMHPLSVSIAVSASVSAQRRARTHSDVYEGLSSACRRARITKRWPCVTPPLLFSPLFLNPHFRVQKGQVGQESNLQPAVLETERLPLLLVASHAMRTRFDRGRGTRENSGQRSGQNQGLMSPTPQLRSKSIRYCPGGWMNRLELLVKNGGRNWGQRPQVFRLSE
jgi:hypothetical protein